MAEPIVIADDQITSFEVVTTDGGSYPVAANKFFHDGLFVHFWLTDYVKMRDTIVIVVRADTLRSIRPVYADDDEQPLTRLDAGE